jgi:peptidoglycan DL-endopeptidase LytF
MRTRWLLALSLALLLAMLVVPVAQAAPAASSSEASCGYWYTVRAGDSWSRVSAMTGVSISALQAANPHLLRPPRNWLYVGDRMWIPCGAPPPPPCGTWYTVRSGDSWFKISRATGVSVSALQAANPGLVRPPSNWLYVGDKMWIPCGSPPPPPTCSYYYTVQRGDSWSRISQSTGVPLNMLYAANPGKVRPPSYVIYVGEVLCIPPH